MGRDPVVNDFFEYLDSLHGFLTDRWGDHAVRTLQLKLFSELHVERFIEIRGGEGRSRNRSEYYAKSDSKKTYDDPGSQSWQKKVDELNVPSKGGMDPVGVLQLKTFPYGHQKYWQDR